MDASRQSFKRRFLAVCLCAVSAGLLAAIASRWILQAPEPPVPQQLDKLDPQARAYVEETLKWVRSAPRDWNRHATLGIVYAANSLWTEARLAFSNVVHLNPKEPLAHLYVGISHQELAEADQALQIFREVTRRFPGFAQGYYRLGEALLKAGDLDNSEKAFQRLAELAPKEWRGYAGIGDVHLRRGEFSQAVKWLEQAVQLDWSAARAHHLLGTALRETGRIAEAEIELSLGLNAVSYPMPDAWFERAPEHMKLLQDQLVKAEEAAQAGQPDESVRILEEAMRFHPTNAMVLNNLAIALNRSGQPQKARPLLLKLLQSDSKYLPAHITLSFANQLLGSHQDALACAERAVELSPTTAQAHVARANALLAMERDAEAVEALETALRCDPKNAEIQIELGDVKWRNLNRPDEALAHYKKAIQLNRMLLKAHVRHAEWAIERGDAAEAEAAAAMIRRLAPREPGLVILENRIQKLRSRR
ncbi:MAG: tetratricopeptide repeat protein [Verrucomicrobia bacterium]|nr:tetratricopeptide repeat protein [Verrucomicrobiota bacterium]